MKALEIQELPYKVISVMNLNPRPIKTNTRRKYALFTFFSTTPTTTLVPVLFFNFSYYVAFCPFKFVKNELYEYQMQKFFPQQVICIFVTATSILHRIAETRMSWPDASQANPVAYFALFHNLANTTYNMLVWYVLWFTGERFLNLIWFLQSNKEYSPDRKLRTRAIMCGGLICLISALVAFFCFIFGTDILTESQWNPELLFKCLTKHGKYALFLTNKIDRCSIETMNETLSTAEIIMTSIYGTSYFFRRIVGIFENMLTAVGPFTLWISANEFIKSLYAFELHPVGWKDIVRRYDYLRQFADLINDVFGKLCFAHLFTAFFFYSVNLDKFITASDSLVRLKFLVYYVIFALTLILASDICRQMTKMEPWIALNINEQVLNDLSQRELAVVLHEIQLNRVSVIGCGLFTLTYSLSAQVVGVIVTYFIISVQYHRFDPNSSNN